MMRTFVLSLALASALAVTAPAFAQTAGAPQFTVSQERALEIARSRGLVQVREIERDDGRWEVEGRDASGRKMEIKIDGRTGEVVKLEYD